MTTAYATLTLAALLFLAPTTSLAAVDPTYAALRSARPQGEGVAVRGLTLERDAFRFRFESGTFQFLAPVEKRTVGAVFVGQGSWELKPSSETERRHLALVSGAKDLTTLTDRFESLVLLFTDETAGEVAKQGAPQTAPETAVPVYEDFLRRARKDLKTNLHLRLLQDIKNGRIGEGVFLAFVRGAKLPPAVAAVDPGGFEMLRLGGDLLGSAECGLFVLDAQDGGIWYLSHRAAEVAAGVSDPPRSLTDADHYVVDTTILRNADIRGTTEIRFQALVPGVRLVPVQLLGRLRIRKAEYARDTPQATWADVPFVQEAADEDADAAVILPEAAPEGQRARLRVSYEGSDVLKDVGEGNFVVGARQSWYANLGVFSDPATFDLTYRVPKNNEVVSVGRLVQSRVDGDSQVAVWQAERPIRVAGFNYGRFKKLTRADKDTGIEVQVFTNPGTPDVIKQINRVLESAGTPATELGSPIVADLDNPFVALPRYEGPRAISVSTGSLAESTLVDAVNAGRVASAYYGPLPAGTISVTQQAQWSFGQSWPSLVFVPYVAYLDSTLRMQLGLQGLGSFVESVAYHELAHQWWGHRVGWETYQDQWLSEGFAEFTAALVLQYTAGTRRYNQFWESARRRIVDKPPEREMSSAAAGPLILGWRLATRRTPSAYEDLVYGKGAYVLHMLRMLMREPGSQTPDANFIATMKDFAATYEGRSPSTRDFKRIVERHMVPSLNATRNGKMDWFFDQWVYGTEIPRYRDAVEVRKGAAGEYQLSGSISQEEVSPSFVALLPVYAELEKGRLVRIGVVPLKGTTTIPVQLSLKLPSKPRKILVNALHEVLAR